MFIGASEDPERELGIEFKPDRETLHTADVFKDLKLPAKSSASRCSKVSGHDGGQPRHSLMPINAKWTSAFRLDRARVEDECNRSRSLR